MFFLRKDKLSQGFYRAQGQKSRVKKIQDKNRNA